MTDQTPPLPAENVGRGTFLALVALPVGVAAWLLIWSWGYIASIVALGVAVLAAFLYRLGAGGRIGKIGAFIVTGITVGTIALAFYLGLVIDVATVIGEEVGLGWFDVATHPMFPDTFSAMVAENIDSIMGDLVLTIVFTALGAGGVIFSVFREVKARAAAEAAGANEPAGVVDAAAADAPAAESAESAAQTDAAPEPDAVK